VFIKPLRQSTRQSSGCFEALYHFKCCSGNTVSCERDIPKKILKVVYPKQIVYPVQTEAMPEILPKTENPVIVFVKCMENLDCRSEATQSIINP
jgi:hypothetical protein